MNRRLKVGSIATALCGTLACGAVAFLYPEIRDLGDLEGIKAKVREDFPNVRQMSTDRLHQRWLQAEDSPGSMPLILDVREAQEFAVSALPGAIRTDPSGDAALALASVPKDQEIVVYCSVGYRSSRLAERLVEAGYSNVWNLEGSIFEWAEKGYPMRQGEATVEKVHPYSRAWAWLVPEPLRAFSPEEAMLESP